MLIDQQNASVNELMDAYLQYNPTRNRALDMTPLFRHLDEDFLTARLDDDRINARPTFHYRLPNSTPEIPGWYLSQSWRAWCVVEKLAEDPDRLQRFASQWQTYQARSINLEDPPWFEELDRLQDALSSG